MLVLSYLQPRIKWKHVCICLLAPLVGSKLPDSAFHTELHLLPSINSTKTGQPSTHSSEWDSLPRWCLVAVTWQLELGSTTPMLRQERIHAPAASFQLKWASVALLSMTNINCGIVVFILSYLLKVMFVLESGNHHQSYFTELYSVYKHLTASLSFKSSKHSPLTLLPHYFSSLVI